MPCHPNAGANVTADRKLTVERLVTEVMNGRDLDVLDELCTPQLAPKLRDAFTSFATAFPDWHQDTVQLVAEGDTVVARFRCHGTQSAPWEGLPPKGRRMKIDEVYFFRFSEDRIRSLWGLEDTWTRIRQLTGEDITLGELGSLSDPSTG